MDEDFFGEQDHQGQHNADAVEIHDESEAQYQQPSGQQDQHYDEFFGSVQQQQQQDPFGNQHYEQQQVPQNNYAAFDLGSSGIEQATNYTNAPVGQDRDFFDASESTPAQLSEHEERRHRLQQEEQERTNRLIAKQNEENQKKNQRIQAAKAFLQNWKQDRQNNLQSRKQACIQEEEVLIESRKKVQYKNSWEKISDNISLKASDHPGSKDVARMKECILNKKGDIASGISNN